MKSLYKTVIVPDGDKYLNTKHGDDKPLILNASINQADFRYVNRVGKVVEIPHHDPKVKVGDRILVHQNVFRQYWGFSTHLRTSASDLNDGTYGVNPGSMYAYDSGDGWKALEGNIFVEPLRAPVKRLMLDMEVYSQRVGKVLLGGSKSIPEGSIVSFTPYSEHLFEFDGIKAYRMRNSDITSIIYD